MSDTKFAIAVKTIIKYRWDHSGMSIRWKPIAEEVERESGLWFDSKTQYWLRDQTVYIDEVATFLLGTNRLNMARERAKERKKSVVEYVARVFGIHPAAVSRLLQMCGSDIATRFEENDGGRSGSEIRKTSNRKKRDCAVRALTLATGIDYDTVLEKLERIQEVDPTTGTWPYAWKGFLKFQGWRMVEIELWKKSTVHNMIQTVPKLGEIPLLAHAGRHLTYIDKGVVKDTGNSAFRSITDIAVKKEELDWVKRSLYALSIEGLTETLILYRLDNLTLSWTQCYEDVGMSWNDGILLRRSKCFRHHVEKINRANWALSGQCKAGDDHYKSK